MASTQNPNLEILELAIHQLGELVDDLVFVGGCATGLLLTDPAAAPVRATYDVDAIAQVLSRAEYYQFAEKLKDKGFREDTDEGAPMCRWRGENVILDVMPIDPKILGFGSDWYQVAQESAVKFALPSGNAIFLITSPFFLITKLDAFKGRGKGDYMRSHDIIGKAAAQVELAAGGTELEVEINGEMYSAKVVAAPLYDPTGDKMRG
jgi:hypothetical protein